MERQEVLELLSQKINGDINLSFDHLAALTGYSKRQLIRLSKELKEKGIEEVRIHGNKGSTAHNRAGESEIDYISKVKELYPIITIAQFRDIYIEDYILNPDKQDDVKEYNLKERSTSFFQHLFKVKGWVSPVKHRVKYNSDSIHTLRMRSPRIGMLVQIDGTPFDWFGDGRMYTLHLAIDDASNDLLAGWFTKNECMYGYCKMMEIIIKNKGVPKCLYSDRHSILKAQVEFHKTKLGEIMDRFDIEMIYANTPQAKGRIERYNGTAQRRLPNDIRRFDIKDYDELNIWFNEFYIPYLNKKFAITPIDPNSEFIVLPEKYDINSLFTYESNARILDGNMFVRKGTYYVPYDKKDDVVKIRKSTTVVVVYFILEQKYRLKYFGKLYDVKIVGYKDISESKVIDNHKELNEFIANLDSAKS